MRKWAAVVGVIGVIGVTAALAGCSAAESPPPADFARDLAGKVNADGMQAQLRKLSEIADANGGTRAKGTPGYDASVDYVAQFLRDKGFDVQTPEFEILGKSEGGNPKLTIAGRAYEVDQASLLITTPPRGLSAITLRPRNAAGCRAADYGDVSVRGAIAVVDDKLCSVVDKQNAAVDKGAVGLLVVSAPGGGGSPATLFPAGYYQQLTVPVGVIGNDENAALRRTNAPVQLVLDRKPVMVKSRNVLAQTKTGAGDNVVMVGAHLDSPPASAGINDNSSGVAAVLETAAALGAEPRVPNAVRFAFWGSEEYALQGASKYVVGLDEKQLGEIALYLDVDMIGSPNAGYFTYDGDQSGQVNPAIPVDAVPEGSAGIERTLAGYLNLAGVRPADIQLARNTDYHAFIAAGVPVGGLTTGASQRKTEAQARLWGGRAGVAFDPNFRTPRDNIDNIDRDALSVMGAALAFATGTYAQSLDGVNGVPPSGERHRRTP